MDKVSLDIVVPIYNEGEKVIKLLNQYQVMIKTRFKVLLCYDLNDDNIINILDIVTLVNIVVNGI